MTNLGDPAPIRFSIIDYLNALPLNLAFKDGLFGDSASLIFDYPSQCADNLAAGKADVGLISSIECQRIPRLAIASGVSIAARNEVRSVLILTKKPLKDIKRVALDRFSRSSVALLRVLLHRRYGIRPYFLTMTPNADRMLEEADAALIIGDAALQLKPGDYQAIDLAREWRRDTGLPFVFAFWAIREGVPQSEIAAMVLRAKRYGLAEYPRRLAEIRARWPLPDSEILTYFTRNIYYDLGADELASLELFFAYAREAHLIREVAPLRLVDGGAG